MLSTIITLLVSLRPNETGQERRLDRKILPVIASLLVLGTVLSLVIPAFAEMPVLVVAGPTLVVRTVAEDDQIRKTGVIILGMEPLDFLDELTFSTADWLAQFKISITYNGIAVNATTLYCQVIEKDKYNPMKDQQFPAENLKTVPKDESGLFVCKWRSGKPGIGVLDVYYVGTAAAEYIADYVLVVSATYAIGRSVVYGTDMQDICVLGYPINLVIDDGDGALSLGDPLGSYVSCEDAALAEKNALGLGIPWT
jgi:hypothetical protein